MCSTKEHRLNRQIRLVKNKTKIVIQTKQSPKVLRSPIANQHDEEKFYSDT